MPSTIPYDPSLVLGQLVDPAKIELLMKIAATQSPADAAEDQLNALISLRQSFDMTIQELVNLDIDVSGMITERQDVNKQITAAAVAYAKAKMQAEKDVVPLKAQVGSIGKSYESPLDLTKSEIKAMPLAADSLKMNCQYFSFDANAQSSDSHAATISSFVSDETDVLGDKFQGEATASAQSQVNSQHQNHSIAGTLVVSIVCTHKVAQMFAPCVIDVDKAILVWNRLFPDKMINAANPASLAKIAATANTEDEKFLTILSGATYGSCFIGMVHVLNTTDTSSSEQMMSVAASMQAQMSVGCWFEKEQGGFGMNSSFSDDAKNLLSTQTISSHCTLISMGSIPSIKSNTVQMGVKQFQDFDGASAMTALAKLQNATATANDSVEASAAGARTGQQFTALKNAQIQGTLSSLAQIDDGANKMIDINSLMDALDDYVQKCLAGNIGVPINYYMKPITQSELAQMWVAKYYPGKFFPGGSADNNPQASGSQTSSS